MEQLPDNSTSQDSNTVSDSGASPDSPEGLSPEEQEEEAAAPARWVSRPLFTAVAALAVILGALAAGLGFYARVSAQNEFNLHSRLERQEEEAALLREELGQAKAELAQARETIGLLAEYSVAAPDGMVPEYTRLYPDMYVPEWTGEAVEGGNVCCLTFDDGPSANTDQVLAVLDRYGIKATFFVVGKTGAADQERMRKIVAAGHAIGMHSWSHNYQSVYASVEAFLEEFNSLYEWIHEVTGVYPSVYRFPGGSINGYDRGVYQEIIAEMTRRGFVYFDWNASAQDATVTPRPAWEIAADCLRGIGRDLVVVLCHDSAARATTVEALPTVIEGYRAAGYTFSTLHPGVRPITFGYPAVK